QAEGTLEYPAVESWQVLAIRKVIRYMGLPDLDWVLAVELPASVTISQLVRIYSPTVAGGILLASLLITSCFSFGNGMRKVSPEGAVERTPEPQSPPTPVEVATAPVFAAAPKAPIDYLYQKKLIAEARKQLEAGKT